MNIRAYLPALALAILAVGALTVAPVNPAIAAPKKAPCVVCVVREGAGPETVRATASHGGKEYYFCREECKAEFLKNPSAFLKEEAPRAAPAFSLKDLSGQTVSLSDYQGKVVLLDFWATFCSPCLKAMPKLQKLHEQQAVKGFSVIGVATDEGAAKVVAPVVKKSKVTYPILISDSAAWKTYGVESLPALFLIDRNGRIVKRFGSGVDHKTIEAEVERLVGG